MTRSLYYLLISPRDPLIPRDGRPFEAGMRVRPLAWLYPSVAAGSLRTLLGKAAGAFDPDALKQVEVAGPLPVEAARARGRPRLFLPAPADLAVRDSEETLECFAARPEETPAGAGCNGVCAPQADGEAAQARALSDQRLYPVLLPRSIGGDFKPATVPAWWRLDRMVRWLTNPTGVGFLAEDGGKWPRGFLARPLEDRRTHVKIEPSSGSAADRMLFQTTGIVTSPMVGPGQERARVETALALRVVARPRFGPLLADLDDVHPMGGERRLVRWSSVPRTDRRAARWDCPNAVRDALAGLQAAAGLRGVRLVLASPALFRHGWLPGWLTWDPQRGWTGTPPGMRRNPVVLRLLGACIERWRPISGWSYEAATWGPKPVRRLVAAGGVYFFDVLSGAPADLAGRWLRSVCDDRQDRRDGFGLALWGVWQPHVPAHTFEVTQ